MDIFARHFHIASVSSNGVVFYESEFESAEQSIDNFISLVANIYAYQVGDKLHQFLDRDTLLKAAYATETTHAIIGLQESQFRVFWASCDGECNGIRPGRN